MEQYIKKSALVAEIKRRKELVSDPILSGNDLMIGERNAYFNLLSFIDTLEVKEINEKSETIYRSKIIKVKCISPFDETWEKGKVYICEKWHHGDLNIDFWDVYYDYDNNPKYVQFSSIEMLEKEFAILRNDTLEVKGVDLEHLEQEVKDFCYKFDDRKDKWYDMTPHDKNIMISPTWSNFAMQLAKHFFVLGLKRRVV